MKDYYDIFEMVYLKWCLQKKIGAKRKNISFDKTFLSKKGVFYRRNRSGSALTWQQKR